MAISKEELLKGRDTEYASDYTQDISDNLDKLLIPLNQIRDAWGKPMTVNSGWRPPAINAATPGAAAHSKHMEGLAADISDVDGSLWAWVMENLQLMKDLDIFMEDRRWTPTWTHFQLGQPTSGHRIFVPSSAPAEAPDNWNGEYDHSFDV
jgi:Peptidase M15